MSADSTENWLELNRKYLMASLAIVKERLIFHGNKEKNRPDYKELEGKVIAAGEALPSPSMLDNICDTFGLTPFERDILLLCAGMELDTLFPSLCAEAHRDEKRAYPTFSLALSVLPSESWEAITPDSPLRKWKIIEIGDGETLTLSPLRIDETILHYLTGVRNMDSRLVGSIEPLDVTEELVPSHLDLSRKIISIWSQSHENSLHHIIQLTGKEETGKRSIAAYAGSRIGITFFAMRSDEIPHASSERENLARLWEREAALNGNGLLLDCSDTENAETMRAVMAFIGDLRGLVIVVCRDAIRSNNRILLNLEVKKPETNEQVKLWRENMSSLSDKLNGTINGLVSQFDLDTNTIITAGAEAIGSIMTGAPDTENTELDIGDIEKALWNSCRIHTRGSIAEYAQRIEPNAGWDDLVLPESQLSVLREIAAHVKQRVKVYEHWGFAKKIPRGLGIGALFSGSSGTGKTLAAEVLANELKLDCFRIDLSAVVNKYIGETEKNLRRVFDSAEDGGAILLFDEADALFGKRSDVKDSHDRYSNIEVSYLLQRMETYRGLAILTTNMKGSLDQAFMRRIRFVVHFQFPDARQRAQIWERVFPDDAPTIGLDTEKLSMLNVAGGNIRNVALNAAFLAANHDEPIGMKHILLAAKSEYAKLEKPLTNAEIGNWI